MSVEEYLEIETKRGMIIKKESNQEKISEKERDDVFDDNEDDENEVYKKREFDEFKDSNPRGWGNTINKG